MEWQPVLDQLARLRDSWTGTAWTWDDRFATIASSFELATERQARTSAMHAFPRGWTAKSLELAPAAMQAIAARSGGVRAMQRLLAGDEMIAARLYGLWWPWGNGETITLRIGIADARGDDDPLPRIRALFGVAV